MSDERIYGVWNGNPKGKKEDITKCIEEIWSDGWISRQCSRERGHGIEGVYCKQHSKIKRGI